MPFNIECKAKSTDIAAAEKKLCSHYNPVFKGEDHQTDTYYLVTTGRLKLREGNIENALIHYDRENTAGSKASNVILYQHKPDPNLKNILQKTLGIKVVVEKRRRIYFIDNVKFHFDYVAGLGNFIEVEAIDNDGSITRPELQRQCDHYARFLGITAADYLSNSYSDMLLEKD